jgi:hypothetical protein
MGADMDLARIDTLAVGKSSRIFRAAYKSAGEIRGFSSKRLDGCSVNWSELAWGSVPAIEFKWKADVLWKIIRESGPNEIPIRVFHPEEPVGWDRGRDRMLSDHRKKYKLGRKSSLWCVLIPHLKSIALFEGEKQSQILAKLGPSKPGKPRIPHKLAVWEQAKLQELVYVDPQSLVRPATGGRQRL